MIKRTETNILPKEERPVPELAEPRQQHILHLVNTDGQALVSALATRFDVSEMTIRRDLKTLEEAGLVLRVHGGAVAGERSRFTNRLSANARAKGRAVAKLAPLLPETGCIYLDGSTTILNLVKNLKTRARLQVATNNVETFNRIASLKGSSGGPTPILLGGSLDTRTDNLIGPLALRSVEALVFECAFFSAWGLAPDAGLNEATMEDAGVKEAVAARARQVLVAVDHTKFGVRAAGAWRHGREKSLLATDLDPGDKRLDEYRDLFKTIE